MSFQDVDSHGSPIFLLPCSSKQCLSLLWHPSILTRSAGSSRFRSARFHSVRPVSVQFSKPSFFLICSRNSSCVFVNVSVDVLLVTALKLPHCLYVQSMVFSPPPPPPLENHNLWRFESSLSVWKLSSVRKGFYK